MANNFASHAAGGGGTLLELSLEELTTSKESLLLLSRAATIRKATASTTTSSSTTKTTDALRNLKNIKLVQMKHVKDEVVQSFLEAIGGNELESLNLSNKVKLMDVVLSSICQHDTHRQLKFLELEGLKHLTSPGL